MTLLDSGPSLAFDERAASAVRPRRYERLVVATHRLPSAGGERPDGEPLEEWLGALGPRLAGGGWVGAAGTPPATGELAATAPPSLSRHAVDLPRQEAADAERFCRRALLPLFHGLPGDCRFEARWWHAYRRTARRFADAVEAAVDPGTLVWAHGPRLTGVAALLRGRWSLARWPAAATPGLAHFLHCPFPPLDHFLALPWRREVLAMLLAHDLLAFESRRDVEHLRECVGALRDDCRVEGAGDGGLIRVPASAGTWREVRLAVVPTGVDFAASSRQAESAEVRLAAERVRAGAGGRRLLVAVERLEPARGVLPLLAAYGALLEGRPEAARDLCLVLAVEAERDG
ncbi:MAG TPA: trehalose-6-phosphate synthase, partial [Thermoanaerobaculia bacterium]|nr:trehalose-6-phosphate synthase [Thermoanaerobaculia bacterium]